MRDNSKITLAELARFTGLSQTGVEKNTKNLQLSGVITRIGPAKGGYWKVNI